MFNITTHLSSELDFKPGRLAPEATWLVSLHTLQKKTSSEKQAWVLPSLALFFLNPLTL